MSALSSIGQTKMRVLRGARGAQRRPSPPAPAGTARGLRIRAARALWFGARMVGGFIWWEMLIVKLIGQQRVDANRMARFVMLARRFRKLAIDLGGVWIKLGQFMSSRVDIMPPEVIAELQDLQDAVPPVASDTMQRIIERELGKTVRELFEEFDPKPIAAASFGQAYLATLRNAPGETGRKRVVVKVQRPNLDDIVSTDLRSLKIIAGWLKRYKPIRQRANVDALVREFGAGVFAELDYTQEAQYAGEFDQNFKQDTAVRVPRVYTEFSSPRVIVLKNVEDIKITDYEGLDAAGVSRKQVARKLFDSYLTQVFTHGFYHADPHPGNLFVQPLDTATARAWRVPVNEGTPFRLTYVDFGMMGRVPPAMIEELKEFIIAISLKDARRWTLSAQRLGFLLPGADLIRIEQAVGAAFDQFWGMGITDITNVEFDVMYRFSQQFKDLLSTLPFQVPQNVLYLGRAANILSGMMVALDPAFNPWSALLPFANGLNAAQSAPGLFQRPLDQVGGELLKIARTAVALPNQADTFFTRALNGQLEMRTTLNLDATEKLNRIERSVSRLSWAIAFAALLGTGAFLLVSGFTAVAAGCGVAGALVLGRMLFSS
jgi:predicted unusual protein kinase regulating ubiquinone biosynthesis (AarF/ABC1/UbiB family)